jgi:hypothetical protein
MITWYRTILAHFSGAVWFSLDCTCLFSSACRSSVVLPAPKNPERSVIGTFFT